MKRKKQINFYKELLNDNDILMLKSSDEFFKNHYSSSPLAVLTNFFGSAGEAIIDKAGKITVFVDTRYHILIEKQAFKDVEIYKMDFNETFFEALKSKFPKNTKLYVPSDILLSDYFQLDKYFDLRKYELSKKFNKNNDINLKSSVFEVDKKVEKLSFEFKIKKFKKINPKIGKIIIFDLDEISYLTNLRSFQSKFSSNFRAYLYLDLINSNYILFSDVSADLKIDNLVFKQIDEFKNYIKSIKDEIFVDIEKISLKNFLLINKPREIKKSNLPLLASIKPQSVIDELKECYQKLDMAIYSFKDKIKEGLSEYDLVQIFEEELFKQGAKCSSFKTILAIGENSASIHYSNHDKEKILNNESIILLDCGAYFDSGYATDITRTFYFGVRPSIIYKKVYTNVLKAFINCFLSDEKKAKEINKLASDILKPFEQRGFYFNHGLGHGIGTSVHQNPPRLSLTSNDIIKPYQVHSIEPGLYGKDNQIGLEFGVRIENCVYWDLNYQRHSLSKFPFEEVLIDYSLLNQEEVNFVKNWQESFKWK